MVSAIVKVTGRNLFKDEIDELSSANCPRSQSVVLSRGAGSLESAPFFIEEVTHLWLCLGPEHLFPDRECDRKMPDNTSKSVTETKIHKQVQR